MRRGLARLTAVLLVIANGANTTALPVAAKGSPARQVNQRVHRQQPLIQAPGPIRTKQSSVAALAAPTPETWTSLGPQPIQGLSTFGPSSGRVTALATNGSTVYAGTADGGVWKSTDSGQNWAPLTDTQPTLAIGALAVDWSVTPQTIYAGTGESNRCQDCLPSQGVLKSTDGGATWTTVGQTTFTASAFYFASMAIDRTATNRVFAATNQGLYLSTDSGVTWAQALAGGTNEIVQDPTTATKFWAAQADFCSSETGNIQTSTNGGTTWSASTTFPQSPQAIRIGLGVGQGGIAYAAIAACPTTGPPSYQLGQLVGVEKTTDGGATWHPTAAAPPDFFALPQNGGFQGWYDNVVAVDKSDATGSRAVFGGIRLLATSNGGGSFTDTSRPYESGPLHPDFHAVAFTGAASTFYAGNDGGVYLTGDLGGS